MIFRVWDEDKNSMYYADIDNPYFFVPNVKSKIHAMIFSWFDDSNGIPIFENDVIEISFPHSPDKSLNYFPRMCKALILIDRDSDFVLLTDDVKCPVVKMSVFNSVKSYVRMIGNRFQNPYLYANFVKMYPKILGGGR